MARDRLPRENGRKAPVECGGHATKVLLVGRFVVVDLAAFQGIAPEQVLEGTRVVADVFQGLAERKVDVRHLVGRQAVGIGGKCLERGEIGIAGAKGL